MCLSNLNCDCTCSQCVSTTCCTPCVILEDEGCLSHGKLSCVNYSGRDITLGTAQITLADTGDDAIGKLAYAINNSPIAEDKYVKIDSYDTTSGYLNEKLVGSDYISLSLVSPSLNEKIKIDLKINELLAYVASQSNDKFVKVSPTDTTASYLITKLVKGDGIKITKTNPSGIEGLNLSVDISPVAGNILTYNSGALYVPTPQTFSESPLQAVDSSTIGFSQSGITGHNITAIAKISTQVGNLLIDSAGLYVGIADSSTIDFSVAGSGTNTRISGAVIISSNTGNALVNNNGLFVPDVSLSFTDTSTIDFTKTGNNVIADVKISSTTGNQLTFNSTGLYIPAATPETTLVTNNSSTINFTQAGTNGHTISASAKISTTAGNQLTDNSGLFIPSKVNGTINKISKFDTTTSVVNSQITDNGTTVVIGTDAAISDAKLQISGNLKVKGKTVNTLQILTYGATSVWDMNLGDEAELVLTGNSSLSIINAVGVCYGVITVKQDNVGGRTLALPAGSKVGRGGSGVITLSSAANAVDILAYRYDGSYFYFKKDLNQT